jgi:hypothetical protein
MNVNVRDRQGRTVVPYERPLHDGRRGVLRVGRDREKKNENEQGNGKVSKHGKREMSKLGCTSKTCRRAWTNAKTTTRLASAFGGVRRRGPPGTGVNLSQNRQRGRITAVGFAWDGSTANS